MKKLLILLSIVFIMFSTNIIVGMRDEIFNEALTKIERLNDQILSINSIIQHTYEDKIINNLFDEKTSIEQKIKEQRYFLNSLLNQEEQLVPAENFGGFNDETIIIQEERQTPYGMANGKHICYANAVFQLLFAIPDLDNYLSKFNTEMAQDVSSLYNNHIQGFDNLDSRLQIIVKVMGESVIGRNQNWDDFFILLVQSITDNGDEQIYPFLEKLNVTTIENGNFIARIRHASNHFTTEVNYGEQLYQTDDTRIEERNRLLEGGQNITFPIAIYQRFTTIQLEHARLLILGENITTQTSIFYLPNGLLTQEQIQNLANRKIFIVGDLEALAKMIAPSM